jgi:membrane fusion protein, adhesin transport system
MKLLQRSTGALAGHALPAGNISAAARVGDIGRASDLLLFTVLLALAALVAWAAVSQVDTVAQAAGKVIPSARVQAVQSLEGGIVQEIHAVAGQAVESGDLLVSLSPVQAGGDLQTRRQQVLALGARIARLQAEVDQRSPAFPNGADGSAEFVGVERAAFESRRSEQASQAAMLSAQIAQKSKEQEEMQVTLATARRALATAQSEREVLARLVEQGLEPRLELLRVENTVSEAEGRERGTRVAIERLQQAMEETRARRDTMLQNFRSQAREELNRAINELRALEQGMPQLQDRVARTLLRAPVRGIVNRVFVNSVGGVAKPGETLVELVPADDERVVEVLVSPRDIGFVKEGQTARVKLTAYDYSLFGALSGKVVQVGADAVTNERGEAFFMVRVRTDHTALENHGRRLPIMAGMQAQVDVVTGSKTVLDYLLKPLVSVREGAFRER